MSTKSSLAYGTEECPFHLYRDLAGPDDVVYLELEGVEFEADRQHVTVGIPAAVWEVVRRKTPFGLEWADKSDAEIQARVEADVDQRIAEFEESCRKNPEGRQFGTLLGLWVYGDVKSPRGEQVANGVAHFLTRRDEHTRIKRQVEALEAAQR